jgi:hypothetical protein
MIKKASLSPQSGLALGDLLLSAQSAGFDGARLGSAAA